MLVMRKEFKISYKIESFDENLIHMIKMLGTITLVDTITHPTPVWAEDDEYYIPRQTLTYEWKVNSGCEELAENLYQVVLNHELLN
jgi:hypothetical protein